MSEAQPQPLRAVPADADTTVRPAPATAAGEPLRPVLPDWLRTRENLRSAARRRTRLELHRAAYHGTRSPAYLAKTLFWGVTGTGWLFLMWLRWWLMPVPVSAHQQAAGEGWRAWKTLHQAHRKATKTRAIISLAVIGAAAIAARAALAAPWTLGVAAAVLVVTAAIVARPEGARIVTPHAVPAEYEKLTQDVITRARWARWASPASTGGCGKASKLCSRHPVRQDGPGWRAEVDLPFGVTATQVIERREQLASGLRRPLGAVWPEPITTEHAGRLELFVGQQDITSRKPLPWPLLKAGTVDIFKPVPVGTDVRGRPVKAPLIYHNYLIGSMPRNGKTGAVCELVAAELLDPTCAMWIHELKGTGDLDAFEELCPRFSSGIDSDSIGYAAESLRLLRAECEKRAPKIKALPPSICPDKRVTREIADRYRELGPLGCTIDECQNLFAHSKYGKQAGEDAEFIIRIGPAMGIILKLATQRPDKESLPTGVSANASIRFCLYVAGQVENDMILGTSAYKNGIRATLFRPEVDAGLGYLKGATPVPKVIKTHYLNVTDRLAVVARAKVLRERAGTLPAAATRDPERDVLADVLAAMGADSGLHWAVLADRLSERYPDRWAGASGDAVSAQCRKLGVPSDDVRYPTTRDGQVLKGAKRESVAVAANRNIAGQPVSV